MYFYFSRMEVKGDFYNQIPKVDFTLDALNAAFDDNDDGVPYHESGPSLLHRHHKHSNSDTSTVEDAGSPTRRSTSSIPNFSSAHPHSTIEGGTDWLLMNESSQPPSRSSLDGGHASRKSRDSMESAYPTPAASSLSLRKSSVPGPASTTNGTHSMTPNRARTSSAPPEIRPGNHTYDGGRDIFRRNSRVPYAKPLPTSERPIDPNSENIINLCGADAEYTVPYASRVFRFFFAVKTENDFVVQPSS